MLQDPQKSLWMPYWNPWNDLDLPEMKVPIFKACDTPSMLNTLKN